jgi:DNA-binding IclR family transcriptional regulator
MTTIKKYRVHSLERGLDLIEILAKGPIEKSLKELSQEAGFNLSTTHRIVDALKSRGYVRQDAAYSKYKLTFKLFELGNAVVEHLNLREEAVPLLKDLANKTGETAYLVILDNDEALCLERIDGYHYVRILLLKIGGRIPLHVGASSRVLMAYLPEEEIERIIKCKGLTKWTKKSIDNPKKLKEDLRKIRERGYALSFEDVVENAAAIGCPVRNWMGEVVAAISVSGVSSHFTKENLPRLIRAVSDVSEELSRRLNAPYRDPAP